MGDRNYEIPGGGSHRLEGYESNGHYNYFLINLEGWGGEGDGREVQKGGGICVPMADSC